MLRCYRLAPLLLAGALVIAGCAGKPTARPAPPPAHTTTGAAPVAATRPAGPAGPALPDKTGIPACDDYLASYVACHRAAAIWPPDQIQGHYDEMRTNLLRDSLDPEVRPQLGSRCTSLALGLRQALHGKSCTQPSAAPAGAGSP
ncbi:hypothetical protein EZM97_17465 [Dyella soli]|uniref:Uncharacterized protein n=2 Tax=Dyella soli TaxID=522319 RepID=A0A4R0YR11_9GAMM|nr:hypothetical protein EZM97_17465 [Dyella soli]